MTRAPSTETRWIILASDGRHVTVGRAAPPTEADLDTIAADLRAINLGGWLCHITVGINPAYALDVLAELGDEVTFRFGGYKGVTDTRSPILILDAASPDWTGVLMPIRVI